MFTIPYTYSLGRESRFERLAELAREKKVWRKVSRMINKYNQRRGGMSFSREPRELGASIYLKRAIFDTKLPFDVKYEIANAFNMVGLKERLLLRQSEILASMTP
jgi:hypothetical protein